MPLVDSHCHLNCLDLTEHDNSLAQVLKQAHQNDVSHFLCVAINLDDFPAVLQIAQDFDAVYASVGLHPNESVEHEPSATDFLERATDPNIVAIGETGLDYYRSEGDLTWQRERFRTQIRVAKQVQKPLIIHSRAAPEDTLRIMREEDAATVGGVMHCFAEDWEMAQACIELNFYISFSGIVTFKNAHTLHDVARRVPLERMLIETDSPYLAPMPYRGKPNQPAYVRYVAEKIAALREISYATVAAHTTDNFFNLFIES